jgi:hypothetical protein
MTQIGQWLVAKVGFAGSREGYLGDDVFTLEARQDTPSYNLLQIA